MLRTFSKIRDTSKNINNLTTSSRQPYLSTVDDNHRLQQMGTMEAMQNVMTGMAKIMGNAKNQIKIEQFQKSMKTYTTEK